MPKNSRLEFLYARSDALMTQMKRFASKKNLSGEEILAYSIVEREFDSIEQKIEAEKSRYINQSSFYRPFGEFLRKIVMSASVPDNNSAVPGDGGFLVAKPEFSEELFQRAYEVGALLSRCDLFDIEKLFSMEVPFFEETSRADGSRLGGVQVFRAAEDEAVSSSKPKFGLWECTPTTLKGLCYVTDRMLQDASMLGKVVSDAFSKEITFILDREIFCGNGVGQCLGITNSGAVIFIEKETGQAPGTIILPNIVKMWSRCWGPSRKNAIWAYNQNCDPEIFSPAGIGNTRYFESGDPYNTLFGRPMIPIEPASSLGSQADLTLICPNEYAIVRKGDTRIDISAHLKFDVSETCFRFVINGIGGQPKWDKPVTPLNGTDSLSPYVILGPR